MSKVYAISRGNGHYLYIALARIESIRTYDEDIIKVAKRRFSWRDFVPFVEDAKMVDEAGRSIWSNYMGHTFVTVGTKPKQIIKMASGEVFECDMDIELHRAWLEALNDL